MNQTNVISIKTKSATGISQKDLVEERLLTLEALKATRALDAKRRSIRGLVEAGAQVEEGPHFAELSKRRRRDGREYVRLVVR
jgi:hypothetical protein